jgi:hypothetical protein
MSSQDGTPSRRSRLPDSARYHASKLDKSQGPLRSTSDGNLIEEETGDWIILDTPPHSEEDRGIALAKNKSARKGPSLTLPESKNGATGLDNPRARKPIRRLIRNKLSGSDRPPTDTEDTTGTGKETLQPETSEQSKNSDHGANMPMMGEIKQYYGERIAQELGSDWLEHALADGEFYLQVLNKILEVEKSEMGLTARS